MRISISLHSVEERPYTEMGWEMLAAYEQAIRLDPNDAIAYHSKGEVLELLGRSREAKQACKQARRLGYSE